MYGHLHNLRYLTHVRTLTQPEISDTRTDTYTTWDIWHTYGHLHNLRYLTHVRTLTQPEISDTRTDTYTTWDIWHTYGHLHNLRYLTHVRTLIPHYTSYRLGHEISAASLHPFLKVAHITRRYRTLVCRIPIISCHLLRQRLNSQQWPICGNYLKLQSVY